MSTPLGAPLPLLRAGCVPLIGRSRQLALLAEHLAEARRREGARRPSVVLLSGAPGIGKTRLLEEFPPPDQAAGVMVLRGGASQAAGMPPYLPFLQALGDYIAAAPIEHVHDQVGPHAATLATLFPEIPARLGPPPPPHPLGPEQERYRLYEAVAAFLTAIAERRPLVLLFDDLHWADAASCDLLVHLAGRLRSVALLIVGAYREGEVAENPAFARALAELNRRRLLLTLTLHPLDAQDSRVFATNALSGTIAPDVADLLHRHSEGNPFFLEELLRALIEEGTLVWQAGRWELRRPPGRLLPPRVVEAIQLRLARLDPKVVELLRVAAVIGRVFAPTLLAQVAQLDVEQAEELLLAAARTQLVRPHVDGAYAFTHDLVRETLSAEVGSARRRRRHQAIGAALEVQGDADSAQRLADLAFHFAEAGELARGVSYALAAGEQALRTSAAVDALTHYRTALHLLGPNADTAQRASAWMGLGDAATLAGDYPQAAAAYHAAQDAWLRSGDAAAAAGAWHRLGVARWRQEAVAEARDAFERSLELLGFEDSPAAAESLLQLADLHATSLGRNAAASAYAERALAMVAPLGDRRLEAEACCVLGNIKIRSNDSASGQALLERALMLAQQLDDSTLAAEACAYLANIYGWRGDVDRSRTVSLLRAELARRTQDPFQLRHVYTWLGGIETILGNWSAAESCFAEQERILEGLQSPEPQATLRAYRGMLHYYRGWFGEAEREYREAIELVRPTGSGGLVWFLGPLGLVLVAMERRAEALDCLTELQGLADPLDAGASARLCAFAYLAVGYARLGEQESAADCYPKLLPFQGQFAPLPVDRALGLAALARGDNALARQHLAEAEAQARRAGMRPELALILLHRALLERNLQAGGASGSGLADEALAEGRRLCAELGMQLLGGQILGPDRAEPGPRAGRSVHPAGLSDRELDVLRLVAQGRTNREIAQTLVLSEKTVAQHLTNIFSKTGVENRAGAAAFALRHDLV